MAPRSPAYHAAAIRNNRRRSRGNLAIRIGLIWVQVPASQRGLYLTLLAKVFRRMLDEGVEPPSEAQIERDIEAAMTGVKRPVMGRSRKSQA